MSRRPFLLLGTLESRIYTIFTLLVFAAVFVVQVVAFRFTIETVRGSTLDNGRVLLGQLVAQIDSYLDSVEEISNDVASATDIQTFLEFGEGETTAIATQLAAYVRARTDVSNILIAGLDGTALSGDPTAEFSPWAPVEESESFLAAMEAQGGTVISSSYVQNLYRGRYSWVVSLSRAIPSSRGAYDVGMLQVDLRFNRIKEMCEAMATGAKGYNFILDSFGNYVFHPFQQLVYSDIRSEPLGELLPAVADDPGSTFSLADRHYMLAESPLTGWKIVSVIHDSDIVTDWRFVRFSYAILGLVLFLVVGLVTNRISTGITEPVRRLQDIMASVDTGEFKLVGTIRATDEIRELAREYDVMVGRIRELMEANVREQEQKRKSDLKALQAQINPHFLYNTLDSIIWMGEMKQNEQVVQMTSALSKLFRISISKGREIIPVSDELAHVESYLTIQEMRYRDSFTYSIDVDPDIRDLAILKITLQPLVENAIYHGIKEVDHQGAIEITGDRQGETVVFQVRDNGKGMDAATLSGLLEAIGAPEERTGTLNRQGMGVRNVHQRIRLYFGEEFGLTCESTPGQGTTMTVRVPAREREELS
jgi:two-component system sensor histidine kinase YesM